MTQQCFPMTLGISRPPPTQESRACVRCETQSQRFLKGKQTTTIFSLSVKEHHKQSPSAVSKHHTKTSHSIDCAWWLLVRGQWMAGERTRGPFTSDTTDHIWTETMAIYCHVTKCPYLAHFISSERILFAEEGHDIWLKDNR